MPKTAEELREYNRLYAQKRRQTQKYRDYQREYQKQLYASDPQKYNQLKKQYKQRNQAPREAQES
jgi:uncharacterized protein YeaO (DUF488 family)